MLRRSRANPVIAAGQAALFAALAAAFFAGAAALRGTRGDERWQASSRRAVYALAVLLTVAVAILEIAFVRSDFSFELVADHSSTTTPTFYKLTAMWSSQGGSLLLWVWVLSLASSLAIATSHRRHPDIAPWATAVLSGLAVFFLGLMLFADGANPVVRLNPAPAEGVGLNPLLRNPAMMIHPPMLYSGYVAFSIPFAFAIGALITRRLDAGWIRSTRRFALLAWTLLGVGLLLGSRWSYVELGWGGFWGWDAVENAALMPWLVGTAFLHSIMVQERRSMFKIWNVALIVATFALALLGTFLVRSGVLQSIHAFGASTVGAPILMLIALILIGSTTLILSRLPDLKSKHQLDSLLSREAVFVVNNLLLIGMAAVIFWGTFFPLISEAATGTRSALGPPWFDRFTAPLAFALVLFTGLGPLLAWRRVRLPALWRVARAPLGFGLVASGLAIAMTEIRSHLGLALLVGISIAALTAIVCEIARAVGAARSLAGGTRRAAFGRLVRRNRRRYGGYLVHVGIVVLIVGAAISSTLQRSNDLRLRPGQSAAIDGGRVSYLRPTMSADPEEQRLSFGAWLRFQPDRGRPVLLRPARNYYASSASDPRAPVRSFFEGAPTSEIARIEGLDSDVWTAIQPDLSRLRPLMDRFDRRLSSLANNRAAVSPAQVSFLQGQAIRAIGAEYLRDTPPAAIRFNLNPLQAWYWLGGLIAVSGAIFALWPGVPVRMRSLSGAAGTRLAEAGRLDGDG